MAISRVFSLVTNAFVLTILSAAYVYFWRTGAELEAEEDSGGATELHNNPTTVQPVAGGEVCATGLHKFVQPDCTTATGLHN